MRHIILHNHVLQIIISINFTMVVELLNFFFNNLRIWKRIKNFNNTRQIQKKNPHSNDIVKDWPLYNATHFNDIVNDWPLYNALLIFARSATTRCSKIIWSKYSTCLLPKILNI